MGVEIIELERALGVFDQGQSRQGKLLRYCDDRRQKLWNRAGLMLMGAVTLAVTASPIAGAVAVLCFLIGDVFEQTCVRHIPKMADQEKPIERQEFCAGAGSLVQTLGVIGFVLVLWLTMPRESAMAMCFAYTGGAVLNSITALSLNRKIGTLRLICLSGLMISITLTELTQRADVPDYLIFDIMGGLMLCFLMLPFVIYVTRERESVSAKERRLITQGLALAKANSSLFAEQQESRRLALIAQSASDAITLLDPKCHILWVNDAFSRLTGYSREEVMGRHSGAFFNAPGEVSPSTQMILDGLANCTGGRIVDSGFNKAGNQFWLETTFSPVFDADGEMEMMVVIDRDITEIKAREAELDHARAAAEQGERAKSAFLATMSHEIRTPMNGIIGMAELLTKSDLNEQDRLYADTIHGSAEALLTIINDILDFSKLNDGHLSIGAENFALTSCIDDVINLMRPQAEAKGLNLTLDVEGMLPGTVNGDDGRLRQILLNVIGNAIKFTETGGVNVAVSGSYHANKLRLAVDVRDSGIGIPEDQLDYIFERFAQADTAHSRRFGGTGLGLAISRRLARLMGGDIVVESMHGDGATFRITVELEVTHVGSMAKVNTGQEVDLSQLAGLRVLLAEDNRTNRLVIEKFFQDVPLSLSLAANGREAVAEVAQNAPDVVLMDMSMPEMDGLEATRVIRAAKDGPQPVIVALTANAYSADRDACIAAGMDAFLSKPVRRTRLLQELHRIATERDSKVA